MEDTLIFWGIHTLDRTRANPFPLEYREWDLQWDLVSETERKHILEILSPQKPRNASPAEEPNVRDEEWILAVTKYDDRMLAYRKYFIQKPGIDASKCVGNPDSKIKHFLPVDTWDDVRKNVQEAVRGHFFDQPGGQPYCGVVTR